MSIPFSKILLVIYLTTLTISDIVIGMGIIKISAFECERCGHIWLPRDAGAKLDRLEENQPKVCPKCKNVYWNTPRKVVK